MAGNTYLTRDATTQLAKEIAATQTSSGATNANQIVALASTGYLDPSLFPAGYGVAQLTLNTTEAVNAGALLNLWGGSGGTTPSWRNANATDATKPAVAFTNAAASSGASCTGYFTGDLITGLSGLTIGTMYFLSTTAGGVVAVSSAPSASGNLVQQIGMAVSTSSIIFNYTPGIIHA